MLRPAVNLNNFETHNLFGMGLGKLILLGELQAKVSESKWNDVFTSKFFENQYQALASTVSKGDLFFQNPEVPEQQMKTMRSLLFNLIRALNTARARYRSSSENKVSAGADDMETNWVEQGACSEDLIMTIIGQLDLMVPERPSSGN